MNKLYLLLALGIAAKQGEAKIHLKQDMEDWDMDDWEDMDMTDWSDGWWAGDCIDPESMSSTFGGLIYDCGSNCLS